MADHRKPALVSIIIPIRNSADYLEACCNSIIDQTYIHWEAILIDDNSNDSSAKIAAHFVSIDPRFRLIASGRLHGDSAGPWLPRNQGLRTAQGEYVAFLDADDLWLRDKLNGQMKLLEQGGYDLCVCSYFRFSDKTGWIIERREPPARHWRILLKFINPIPLSTVVIRRELMRDGFRAVSHEDHDAWQRLFATRKIRYASCGKALAAYRIHPESLTGTWRRKLTMRQAQQQDCTAARGVVKWLLFLVLQSLYLLRALPWRLQRRTIEMLGFRHARHASH